MTTPKPLRTLRGHTAYARFLHNELENARDADGCTKPLYMIRRPTNIPSPYRYSPDWPVDLYRGQRVVIFETSHAVYRVFAVKDCVFD